MIKYYPEPIDTSQVQIPGYLQELGELLAINTHDNFVSMRLKEGWVWGEHRDDNAKTNPTLVPFSELPENERIYDRITSMETLKVILSLGYRILPPEEK